jgi:uncharacterized membrane protein (DUF2068 family)
VLKTPRAIKPLSLFFAFGTAMSGLTAVLLAFPGTALDQVWRINPAAQAALQPMDGWAVLLMATVCASCAIASVGLWRLRPWGYWSALIVLAVNLIGDVLNALIAQDWRTLIGLPIGAAMIAYLVSSRMLFTPRDAGLREP